MDSTYEPSIVVKQHIFRCAQGTYDADAAPEIWNLAELSPQFVVSKRIQGHNYCNVQTL